jgi:hypothetical protein
LSLNHIVMARPIESRIVNRSDVVPRTLNSCSSVSIPSS